VVTNVFGACLALYLLVSLNKEKIMSFKLTMNSSIAASALIFFAIFTSSTAQATTINYRNCGSSCVSLDVLSDISLDLGYGSHTYDMFIAWGESFSQATANVTVSIPTSQGYAFQAINAVDQALRDLDYFTVAEHGSIFLNMAYGPEGGGRYSSYWIALNDSDTVEGTFVDRSGSGSVSATGTSVYPLVFFTEVTPVPVPAAIWLFGTGLIGLVAVAKKRKA